MGLMINRVLSVISPDMRCIACGEGGEIEDGICLTCRAYLPTFSVSGVIENITVPEPAFSKAISAFSYEGIIRELIHAMKFKGYYRNAGMFFAEELAEKLISCGITADVCVPVPLSRERMLSRGYNQSSFVAQLIAKKLKISFNEDIIWRTRKTAEQAKLDIGGRLENVKGAFAASPSVKGKSVLLVDDVLTTGATASACALALRCAGAIDVVLATAAVADYRAI